MSNALKNLVDAAQPSLPSVPEFMGGLQKFIDGCDDTPPDAGLFGDIYSGENAPGGTKVDYHSVHLVRQFQAMCLSKNVIINDLDDFFVALAKFVLDPKCQFEDAETQEKVASLNAKLASDAGIAGD